MMGFLIYPIVQHYLIHKSDSIMKYAKQDIINTQSGVHQDKHTAKIIIKLATAMPGAVAAWLVSSKLKDDSRALETICMDGF